jgi:hypothetical protein
MQLTPLPISGSIIATLRLLLPKPTDGSILVIGDEKTARQLILDGFQVITDGRSGVYAAIVAFDLITNGRFESIAVLRELGNQLETGRRLFLIEKSESPQGGKTFLGSILRLLGKIHSSTEISALMLEARYTDIHQIWPQGINSVVITHAKT